MLGSAASRCFQHSPAGAHGGAGAAPSASAQNGANATNTGAAEVMAGGGGGGLGRIRINTADGTYTKSNTSIEAGALTSGTIATR